MNWPANTEKNISLDVHFPEGVVPISTIIELLFDLAGEIIGHFITDPESKLEKHINRLREEEWFSVLEKDYRYGYIIHENRKVRRFICNEKYIKMILSMDVEREKFISLVKDEHANFTKIY